MSQTFGRMHRHILQTRSEPKARTARQDAMDKTRNSKDRQGGGNRPAAPLLSQPKPIRPATRKGKEAFGQIPMDISEDVFHPQDDHNIVEDPEIRRNNFRAGREADLQEKRTETFSPA